MFAGCRNGVSRTVAGPQPEPSRNGANGNWRKHADAPSAMFGKRVVARGNPSTSGAVGAGRSGARRPSPSTNGAVGAGRSGARRPSPSTNGAVGAGRSGEGRPSPSANGYIGARRDRDCLRHTFFRS
jgi:hypothetical protein